jgi:DNA-binding HxlR family transcriptional regulator
MRTVYTPEQIARTSSIVKVIGDASNVLIMYELMNFGEKSFNELKRMTDINAVTLSKKLTHLKLLGLVSCRSEGIEKRYSVTAKSQEFRPLIKDIEQLVINA